MTYRTVRGAESRPARSDFLLDFELFSLVRLIIQPLDRRGLDCL